jgi:hypothetical protein
VAERDDHRRVEQGDGRDDRDQRHREAVETAGLADAEQDRGADDAHVAPDTGQVPEGVHEPDPAEERKPRAPGDQHRAGGQEADEVDRHLQLPAANPGRPENHEPAQPGHRRGDDGHRAPDVPAG